MKVCERVDIDTLKKIEKKEIEKENTDKLVDLESGLGFLISILD